MRHGRLKPNIFLKPENDPSLSFQNVDVVNKSKLASHKTAYTIDTHFDPVHCKFLSIMK